MQNSHHQKTEKRGGRKTPEGPGPLRLRRLAQPLARLLHPGPGVVTYPSGVALLL